MLLFYFFEKNFSPKNPITKGKIALLIIKYEKNLKLLLHNVS